MTLGIGLASKSGSIASMVYLFNHAIIKGGLFLAMACIVLRINSVQLENISGLGKRMPWTMAAIVLLGLGLIGAPFTAGFISKWHLLVAAIEQKQWLAVVVIVGGSLLTIMYIWKIVEHAYFRKPSHALASGVRVISEAPLAMLIPLWLMVAANFYFGVNTSFSYGFANTAINTLFQ